MRYELTDYEWAAIKASLPNKPRGVPRVNDRRVLNGIFWVLRSGAPWRDLPDNFGPYTTCYIGNPRIIEAATLGRVALAAAADQFAANVLPIIREIQAAGHASANAIAGKLNERGVRSRRGGRWSHVQVGAILARAA